MKKFFVKKIVNIVMVVSLVGCTSNPVQYAPVVATNNSDQAHLGGTYSNSIQLREFIKKMVIVHGFPETYLNNLFSKANHLDYVEKLEVAQGQGLVKHTSKPMNSKHTSKPMNYAPIHIEYKAVQPSFRKATSSRSKVNNWTTYRKQFITKERINTGVEFWSNNANAIQRASQAYGVNPEYIVAIIGVETFFGKNVGKTRTLDALTTLAFDTDRRSKFFTTELEHFLLMTREEGYDPLNIKGSWAGAMGLGQFMPSSFRRLAVDYNNDGHRNLWDQQDAVGSVANYFSKSGWQNSTSAAERTRVRSGDQVIEFVTDGGSEYWSVHPNFKVIKKYNNSNKYAMAVHQLAQAIKFKRING